MSESISHIRHPIRRGCVAACSPSALLLKTSYCDMVDTSSFWWTKIAKTGRHVVGRRPCVAQSYQLHGPPRTRPILPSPSPANTVKTPANCRMVQLVRRHGLHCVSIGELPPRRDQHFRRRPLSRLWPHMAPHCPGQTPCHQPATFFPLQAVEGGVLGDCRAHQNRFVILAAIAVARPLPCCEIMKTMARWPVCARPATVCSRARPENPIAEPDRAPPQPHKVIIESWASASC